ncbi:lysozyme inhibitor LprI family protein [Gammaproteobacteria bacterium AB-CW1]|uniref:Lysozyme inhibitor LprI family protein n=1 Tax=Natronospira elongata TaxID=3110268 RepID=A0AAP6MM17_9GAMM|nr:lysozyme inhibitor LprI family protein [Gammaproteobacteria bacterium AB-CW1]
MRKTVFVVLFGAAFSAVAADKTLDCDNPKTTLQVNECAAMALDASREEMAAYLEASLEHNGFDPELVEAIESAQEQWDNYVDSHCGSVYTQWRDGTIRDAKALSCKTRLTRQRTHEIWLNFLTYMDSTPPVLPEPAK